MKNKLSSVYKDGMSIDGIASRYARTISHQIYAGKGFYKEAATLGFTREGAFVLKKQVNQKFRMFQKQTERERALREIAKEHTFISKNTKTFMKYLAPELYNTLFGMDVSKTIDKQKLNRQIYNLTHNSFGKNQMLRAINKMIASGDMDEEYVNWLKQQRSDIIENGLYNSEVINEEPILNGKWDSESQPELEILKEFMDKAKSGKATEDEFQDYKAIAEAMGLKWNFFKVDSLYYATMSYSEKKKASSDIADGFLDKHTK